MEMEPPSPPGDEVELERGDSVAEENAKLRAEVRELKEQMQFYREYWEKHSASEAVAPVEEDFPERLRAIADEATCVASLRDRVASGVPSSEAALALGPNVSLEYTRDSPMFRRSAVAFEQSLDGLGEMLRELSLRVRAWTKAQRDADAKGRRVAAHLRDRRHARCLFSGAHASLGDLTAKGGCFADCVDALVRGRSDLSDRLDEQVAAGLEDFTQNELGDVASFRADVMKLGDVYEQKLCAVLQLDAESLSEDTLARLQDARSRFERARFALVRYLNGVDAKKMLAISAALGEGAGAVKVYHDAGSKRLCGALSGEVELTRRALSVERERHLLDEELWDKVLERLEAELSGELPPPGAPRGARAAPADIARLTAAPTWSAALTTEVLSKSSLRASRRDLAHARDEGVLKQGYLHRRDDGLGGALVRLGLASSKRKWHRLHNGALYVVEDSADSTTAEERKVCDLRGCTIARGTHAGGATTAGVLAGAFAFGVVKPDGHRLALQAENDDELIKWISALRRSTKLAAAPQRSAAASPNVPADAQNGPLLQLFVADNPVCAECGAPDVEWVSMAVGCALCVDCATIHRKLGAEFSKLRALWLDRWSPLMLKYLHRAGGNARANAVWERETPSGWTKPGPLAPAHVKEQWIVAKYVWNGFLGKPGALDGGDDAPSRALTRAAARGDVHALKVAFANKGLATWRDPSNKRRTALHVATSAGAADAVAFLLLNGGDVHQLDDDDATALCLASASDSAVEVAQLILEHEQGDLW